MVHEESLAAVIGKLGTRNAEGGGRKAPLRSPGQLRRHYAPKARLAVLHWRDEADLKSQISTLNSQVGQAHIIAHTRIPKGAEFGHVSVIARAAAAFARAIYAELHRCDEAGAALIVVEALPGTAAWRALADRLRRAAAV